MEPWVVAAVKRFLTRRAEGLQLLALDWFGGEPLLAMDILEEIQKHALALSNERPKLRLRSSLATNGSLLDQHMFARLIHCGVHRFQIAVDGPPETHNERRVTAGGNGTFDLIWSNLQSAQQTKETFKIIVRLQVADDPPESVEKFLNMYAFRFADDERFVLAVVPLSCFSPSATFSVDTRHAVQTAKTVRRTAETLGIRLCERRWGPIICHAARANAFLVHSDGALGKCPVALERPENHVGNLLKDGRVEIDDVKMNQWTRGLASGDETELRCPMIGYADVLASE